MGNIFADIAEDIEIKPSRSKILIKWVFRFAYVAIAVAFTWGQIRTNRITRLNGIESSIGTIKVNQQAGFDNLSGRINDVNDRIDKVYDDGYNAFLQYDEYNKKQFELLIDYGAENKELLKRMLELNSMEQTREVTNDLTKVRNTNTPDIPINENKIEIKPYYSMANFIELSTNDTTFSVSGATQEYINSIDTKRYIINNDIRPSAKHTGRFDFSYKNK